MSTGRPDDERHGLKLPSREAVYAAVIKWSRRAQGIDPDPAVLPFDGPRCRHGNPRGNCFDCE